MPAFLAILLAYLLGSIPFGLVLALLAGQGDIRKIGSGNIGATNVLRTGKKGLALATLVLDCLKGTVAVLAVEFFSPGLGHLAGLAVLLGHIFPVWLGFKGGKGVATAFGVALAVAWPVALGGLGVWLAVVVLSRLSSLAALSALASAPFLALAVGRPGTMPLLLTMVAIVMARHHANIRRLIAGTEPKIGQKKDPKDTPAS